MHRRLLSLLLPLIGCAAIAGAAPADALEEAIRGLGSKSRVAIVESIERLAALDDLRALPPLEALVDRRLHGNDSGRVVIEPAGDGPWIDALTGEAVEARPADVSSARINNLVRRRAKALIAQLRLRAGDPAVRLAAAEELRSAPVPEAAGPMRRALADERDTRVGDVLEAALAQIDLAGDDRDARLAAIDLLGRRADRRFQAQLEQILARDGAGGFVEPDAGIRAAAERAIRRIESATFFIDLAGNFFYGLSLASVLLLAALGLAITFGLMNVINMAHGEMLMVGAYTTWVVLGLFEAHAPSWFDWYLVAAVPAAFAICGLLGMALERSVIRFLYGRPLETLLATWGISLVLIQTVRLLFGAQNVEVANPSWLSGGYEVLRGVVLPWSRIAIVLFAGATVVLVHLMLQHTRLGLWVRAVTQNRRMAAGLGIPTARVDMLTFGLGSGIAGLGGVALSQIGNVGPELGQAYIVDSFMVVVLGGVGNVMGAVLAALGLGVVSKFLEPFSGAVLGKILVLAFLILFIQIRPQGIFALRGRAAES